MIHSRISCIYSRLQSYAVVVLFTVHLLPLHLPAVSAVWNSLTRYHYLSSERRVFFCPSKSNSGPDSLVFYVSISHTIRHTHPLGLLWTKSARRRGRYLHNRQQTQQVNIYALSGIRNHDPRNQAAADQRLAPARSSASKLPLQLYFMNYILTSFCHPLTLILLMWKIGWAHNNARK